jgi:NADH dehydrogenase FAD-containing subunit
MGKRLLLVGGGHAHMVTLANLKEFVQLGHAVTVVGPSPYHYYSGMGPGMLGKIYRPEDIRFATRRVVESQGGVFHTGKAVGVDPVQRTVELDSGRNLEYDVVSFNAGSYVPSPSVVSDNQNLFAVKPIEKLLDAQARVLALTAEGRVCIAVVGGGPAAVEIAGNLWRLGRYDGSHGLDVRIFSGEALMASFPEKVRRKVRLSLDRRGIEVQEHAFVTEAADGRIGLQSGRTYQADLIFLATGVRPATIFKTSGLPVGPDGGLRVNRHLQCVEHPEIFGGGDCIYFEDRPLDKVGVYAVRQNPVLFHNLMAALEGGSLQEFDPGGDYLLIFNLGDGTGVLHKRWLTLGGRTAFWVKNAIDVRFMKKFQALENGSPSR